MTTLRVQVQLRERPRPKPAPGPARIAHLLALAHRLEREVRAGKTDMAGIARRFGLTRARVSQLANLVLLAPAIQAEITKLQGRDITERAVRTLSAQPLWRDQLARWRRIRPGGISHPQVKEPRTSSALSKVPSSERNRGGHGR